MAEAYLKDKKRVLPCAAYLSGEYGVNDFYVGVQVVIGAGGVEKVVEIKVGDEAKENFQRSVDAVEELLVACKDLDHTRACLRAAPLRQCSTGAARPDERRIGETGVISRTTLWKM